MQLFIFCILFSSGYFSPVSFWVLSLHAFLSSVVLSARWSQFASPGVEEMQAREPSPFPPVCQCQGPVAHVVHRKINMEPNNGGFENDFPFQLGDF